MVQEESAPTPKSFRKNSDLTFQFKLARELGLTVGELQAKLSVLEYQQWIGFYLWEKEERDKVQAIAEAEAKKKANRVK